MNKKVKALKVSEFVTRIFDSEFDDMIYASGYRYLRFLPLIQSLEFLGSLEDEEDFGKKEEVEARFNRGLLLLGEKYERFTKKGDFNYLYTCFRNPFIHQFRPDQSKIRLATRSMIGEMDLHLTRDSGRLCFVLEDFYEDIKRGALLQAEKIKNGVLAHEKLDQVYLTIEVMNDFIETS